MRLYSSVTSPFGRKIKIAAAALGLSERITVVATDTTNPDDPILGVNPLGKIPALALDDGSVLFDSRVILEYFDVLAPGTLLPAAGKARFAALVGQALADGIVDAAILQVYEGRMHPGETASRAWLERQGGKVSRALKVAEANVPVLAPRLDSIALACALGYLDFRFRGDWRETHPALARWVDDFAVAVPAFAATKPQG